MRLHSWQHWSKNRTLASAPAGGRSDLSEHLDEIIREWPTTCSFSARSLLHEHPSIGRSRSAVVAVAAEEYLRHRMAGQVIDLPVFAADFGELADSVVRAGEVMDYFLSSNRPDASENFEFWPGVGDRIQHFELLELLGGGLLSRVYIACDTAVAQRLVVVKLTRSSEREIRALGRLSHPGIVPILSMHVDQASGLTAVVMPFQSRVTLYDVIDMVSRNDGIGARDIRVDQIGPEVRRRNALAPCPVVVESATEHRGRKWHSDWVADTGAAVADALQAAHSQGVLHCDVKPSNIVIVNQSCPMLVDFNLCLGQDAKRVAIGGTIPYMSPEQLCGDALDERADVFSLAATLYHVLTAEPPFGGAELTISQALTARVCSGTPRENRYQRLVDIDVALAPVILKGLAPDRADRYPTAASFSDALRQCTRSHIRLRRGLRRRKRQIWAGACIASFALAGMAAWDANRAPPYVRDTIAALDGARSHDDQRCFTYADRALSKHPDYVPALVLRGDCYLRQGEYNLAYSDLNSAAELTDDARLHALLAYAMYRLNENDHAAVIAMERSLKLGMDSAILRNNLGFCYLREGRFNDAAEQLNEAVELDPAFGLAWFNLAVLDWRLAVRDDKPSDTQSIQTALACLGDACDAHYLAAQIFIQNVRCSGTGEAEAMSHARQAMELGLPRSLVMQMLGRLHGNRGADTAAMLGEQDHPNEKSTYERLERFVIPFDPKQVAASLLKQQGALHVAGADLRSADASADRQSR